MKNEKTFLEKLGERDRAAEKVVTEQRAVERYIAGERFAEVQESAWDTQDPFQTPARQNQSLAGTHPNDLLHYTAASFHAARPGSRRDGDYPPFYRMEQQHWMIVWAARILDGLCTPAINVLDILTEFCIFTGFDYTVLPREMGENKPLVKKAQRVLDDWFEQVNWKSWEREIFRRSRRDGSGICRLDMETDSGLPDLVSVEPEQLREPHNVRSLNGRLRISGKDASWKYGILKKKRDTSKVFGYWVVSQYSDAQNQGEFYKADEIWHVKTEWPDRMAAHGVSDFFSVANDMPRTTKLLRSMVDGGTIQALIAYIREAPEGMSPTNISGGFQMRSRQGDTVKGVHMDGPNVLSVSNGYKYHKGPLADKAAAEALIKLLQAGLRGIGIRWQLTEPMISGDASNGGLAAGVVAEAPMVKAMTYRQSHYGNEYRRLCMRILQIAAKIGKLGTDVEDISELLCVAVAMPDVAPRHKAEDAEIDNGAYDRGAMSPQTYTARRGMVFEQEQANKDQAGEIETPDPPGGPEEEKIAAGTDNERTNDP